MKFWPSHSSDLELRLIVDTLPDSSHAGVSARTGWHGLSILRLAEIACVICSFYFCVALCEIVSVDLSLKNTLLVSGMLSCLEKKTNLLVSYSENTCDVCMQIPFIHI